MLLCWADALVRAGPLVRLFANLFNGEGPTGASAAVRGDRPGDRPTARSNRGRVSRQAAAGRFDIGIERGEPVEMHQVERLGD